MTTHSDADLLLAALRAQAQPDGSFARNLNTVAAEVGLTPDALSVAMSELVERGEVEPTHPDGDPGRRAGSSWRVSLGDEKPAKPPAKKPAAKADA